ncbi:MAG TPA: hypothetical protein VFP94_02310 [Terriglobales bacterium]|nr:hypothetical protein [Terriglobales bacterium]
MTIEEMLRTGAVRTANNGLMYAVVAPEEGVAEADERGLERMVEAVPRALLPRLGRAVCYFVPWLYKQRRSVLVGTAPAAEGENRKELCHHLDVKPAGNLLLISLKFYEHDSYGLAMEFFDKTAYLATLESPAGDDFDALLRRQLGEGKPGELTPEAWEWRESAKKEGDAAAEAWLNYRRAAETDALGLYTASLYTDVFYEDLFEDDPGFPPLEAEQVYERVRAVERLYPPNRGYSLQIVRQRPRRRPPAAR